MIYGRWLADANAIWQEQPDDWRRVDRDVFYDQLGSRWILSFTIFKYNGGSITIRGSANSLLNLAEKLLISLNAVPAPEAFSPDRLSTFAAELRAFDQRNLTAVESMAVVTPDDLPVDETVEADPKPARPERRKSRRKSAAGA